MADYGHGSLSTVTNVKVFDYEDPRVEYADFDSQLSSLLCSASGSLTAGNVEPILGIPSSSTLAKIRHSEGGRFAATFRSLYALNIHFSLSFLTNLCNSGQLSPVDATSWLFPYLIEKNGYSSDLVYFTMLQICDPRSLAEIALKSFREGKSERLFALSVSILSDLKFRSMEAFDFWVENVVGREIEQFYFTMLNLDSVSYEQKLIWLNKLAGNISFIVKEHLLLNMDLLPDKKARLVVLNILSEDSDFKIKSSAKQILDGLR